MPSPAPTTPGSARANEPLRELLTAMGLTTRIGAEHIYPSVRAAVTAYDAQFNS